MMSPWPPSSKPYKCHSLGITPLTLTCGSPTLKPNESGGLDFSMHSPKDMHLRHGVHGLMAASNAAVPDFAGVPLDRCHVVMQSSQLGGQLGLWPSRSLRNIIMHDLGEWCTQGAASDSSIRLQQEDGTVRRVVCKPNTAQVGCGGWTRWL